MKYVKTFVLEYFRLAAKIQLSKNKSAQVIAITGSAGKSSTREAIVSAIGNSYQIKHCSFGNSETGIPLDILDLKPRNYTIGDWARMIIMTPWQLLTRWNKYELIVLEMGIDSPEYPKNMEYLLTIIKPNIGVFTNISTVHGENYDHQVAKNLETSKQHQSIMELIAKEKSKLILSLPLSGSAVINCDSQIIMESIKKTNAKILTFGTKSQANFKVLEYHVSPKNGTQFTIQFQQKQFKLSFPKYVLSPAYGLNLASALAVANVLNIPIEKSIDNIIDNFKIPPGRMRIFPGVKHTYLIDSTYNASFASMQDSLQLLKLIKSDYKIAVLGDMREVGKSSVYDHNEIIKFAKSITKEIIVIGQQFKSLNNPNVQSFLTADQAFETLKQKLIPGTTVLFKGSQNQIFLEYLLEKFLENPHDCKFLCRQNQYWVAVKSKFFNF